MEAQHSTAPERGVGWGGRVGEMQIKFSNFLYVTFIVRVYVILIYNVYVVLIDVMKR
jgi:hypothetical protein